MKLCVDRHGGVGIQCHALLCGGDCEIAEYEM